MQIPSTEIGGRLPQRVRELNRLRSLETPGPLTEDHCAQLCQRLVGVVAGLETLQRDVVALRKILERRGAAGDVLLPVLASVLSAHVLSERLLQMAVTARTVGAT